MVLVIKQILRDNLCILLIILILLLSINNQLNKNNQRNKSSLWRGVHHDVPHVHLAAGADPEADPPVLAVPLSDDRRQAKGREGVLLAAGARGQRSDVSTSSIFSRLPNLILL